MSDSNRNEIAEAIVFAAKHLGFGDAETGGMGALEQNALRASGDAGVVGGAIDAHGEAVERGLNTLARAVDGLAETLRTAP